MYTPVTVPGAYLAGIILLTALAIMLFQLRKSPGAGILCGSQVLKILWLTSCLMFSFSASTSEKLYWIYLEQATIVMTAFLGFEFFAELSQFKRKIPKAVLYIIRGLAACLMLLILLDSRQIGWYWSSCAVSGDVVTCFRGRGARLAFAVAYLVSFGIIGIACWWILKSKGFNRKQAVAISAMPFFTFGTNALERLHIFTPHLLQMIGFLLSGVYITWLFYRWRVYTILPLAHETVTNTMIDSLVVIGSQGYVIEMNEAARLLFNVTVQEPDTLFRNLAPDWPELCRMIDASPGQSQEIAQPFSTGFRHFMVTVTPLIPAAGNVIGKVLVLEDITEQKRDQLRLIEQEKTLSVLRERNRLGRELHDTQGQFPGYVKAKTQAIRLLLQRDRPDDAAQCLDQLVAAADAAFSDVRESITDLSEVPEGWNFPQNLKEWLKRFQAMSSIGVSCTLPEQTVRWMAPATGIHLLRIIQESCTNVRKHADASRIELLFDRDDQHLIVTIADNGCGFDQQAVEEGGGYGLNYIKQRLQEVGGSCSINTAPGKGAVLTVQVPLTEGLLP